MSKDRQIKAHCKISFKSNMEYKLNEGIKVHGGKIFSLPRLTILNALFTQHPRDDNNAVYFKRTEYDINIEFPEGSGEFIWVSLTLGNNIIFHRKVSSQKKAPALIFRPTQEEGQRVLSPHIVYRPVSNDDDNFSFSVLHPFANVTKVRTQPAERIRGAMARGGFGAVFEVIATISSKLKNSGKWIYKLPKKDKERFINKERVMKVLCEHAGAGSFPTREGFFLSLTDHLSYKGMVKDSSTTQKRFYFLQKKGEMTLDRFLKADRFHKIERRPSDNRPPYLTIEERYILSINVLRAIKEQLHDRGITSFDIKLLNILIDPDTLEVLNIDLGIGKTIIDAKHKTPQGTPEFASPEQILGLPADERADLFSAGIVISKIWRSGMIVRGFETEINLYQNKDNLESHNNQDTQIVLPPLFGGIADKMSPSERQAIPILIAKLINKNPDERGSFDEAIYSFLQIILNRDDRSEESKIDVIMTQIKSATKNRERLKEIAKSDEYLLENFARLIEDIKNVKEKTEEQLKALHDAEETITFFNRIASDYAILEKEGNEIPAHITQDLQQAIDSIKKQRDTLEEVYHLKKSDTEKLRETLKTALTDVDPNVNFILGILNVKCLKKVTTVAEAIKEIGDITDEAESNLSKLYDMKKLLTNFKPDSFEDRLFLFDLDKLIAKFTKEISLDALFEANILYREANPHLDYMMLKITHCEESQESLTATTTTTTTTSTSVKDHINFETGSSSNVGADEHAGASSANQPKTETLSGGIDDNEASPKKYSQSQILDFLDYVEICLEKFPENNELLVIQKDALSVLEKVNKAGVWNVNQSIDFDKPVNAFLNFSLRLTLSKRKEIFETMIMKKITNIKTFGDLENCYKTLKLNESFIKREQGFIGLFQTRGTTATWARIITSLQNRTAEMSKENITEDQSNLVETIRTEKNKRSFRKRSAPKPRAA